MEIWRKGTTAEKSFLISESGFILYFSETINKTLAYRYLTAGMKTKLHHILLSACIASLAIVSSSYAQEHGSSDYEVVDSEHEKAERDKILYSPGEGETRYVVPTKTFNTPTTQPQAGKDASKEAAAKETLKEADLKAGPAMNGKVKAEPAGTHLAKSTEKQATQPKANDDGTILSFNFLYYIIQKYKLQDIIID
jgi:hypothetical protein